MPKWDCELRIIDLRNDSCDNALWPAAESEVDAEMLVAAHNADIDALENEVYEWKEMFHAARADHRACQEELHKLKGLE